VAQVKTGELTWFGQAEGLSLTPVPGLGELSFGWMGGARLDSYIAAVSKWRQEHDRLLALILVYSMRNPLALHHIGFRHKTEAAMLAASATLGPVPLSVPPSDHQRHYHLVADDRAAHGKYYIEHQCFADPGESFHWDVVTPDPEGFLAFIAGAYGRKPTLWDDPGQNGPHGVVWVEAASDKSIMGVMARPRYWEIETTA